MANHNGPRIINENELHLIVPLTPSRNEVDKWVYAHNFRKLSAYKRAALDGVKGCLLSEAFLPIRQLRPWAERIEVEVVRCSDKPRFLDDDNALGGCKAVFDALVKNRFIMDDTPKHMGFGARPIEARARGQWGDLQGPATHLFISRA